MAGVILWAPNKLPVLHNPIADPNQRKNPSCQSGMTYPGPLKARVDFNHSGGLLDKVGQVESHPRSLSYSFRLECVFSGRRDGPLFAVDQFIGNAASVLGSQRRHSRGFDRSQFAGEFHLAAARRQDKVAYLAGDAKHGQQQGRGRHRLGSRHDWVSDLHEVLPAVQHMGSPERGLSTGHSSDFSTAFSSARLKPHAGTC
jgi:hypothetical protein